MHRGPIVELAPFVPKPGVAEAAILAAAERMEAEFLSQQPGYLGRAVTLDGDGRWMDIVLWADHAAAEAILPKIPSSPACAAYFDCMQGADPTDPAGGVTLLRALRTFGRLAVR
jgi:hypothetical protein